MSILVLKLEELDPSYIDVGQQGRVVYTEKIGVFENKVDALDYSKDKENVLVIDCNSKEILQQGIIHLNKKEGF